MGDSFQLLIPSVVFDMVSAVGSELDVLMAVKPGACVVAASPGVVMWTQSGFVDVGRPRSVSWPQVQDCCEEMTSSQSWVLAVSIGVDQVRIGRRFGDGGPMAGAVDIDASDDAVPLWRPNPHLSGRRRHQPARLPVATWSPPDVQIEAVDGGVWSGWEWRTDAVDGVVWWGWFEPLRP